MNGGGGGGEGVGGGGGGGVSVAWVVGNARRNRAGGVDGGMLVAQAPGPPAWNQREEALSLSAGTAVGLVAHIANICSVSETVQHHATF